MPKRPTNESITMNIVHISAECYPVAKVGGLADVVGALPKYQQAANNQVAVIMPFYDLPFTQKNTFNIVYKDTINLGKHVHNYSVLQLATNDLGYNLYLIDIRDLLFTDYVYSNDDTYRFIGFQIAALDFLKNKSIKPDIIHCHDHHTGLIPFMLRECYDYTDFRNTPNVLTIHNAQYQGWFSYDHIDLIPAHDPWHAGLLDWSGSINALAAAIKCAWRVTTVSPSYMEELKTAANGLESLLAYEHGKCVGILNGIDTAVWNPATDSYLKKNYTTATNISGKKANKNWLCTTYNLDPLKPLFVFIGRLVYEKGSDLFPEAFKIALENNEINILLLGSGDKVVENQLLDLKSQFEGRYNAHIGYDEQLSHIIYAGADFLLMPSRVEPCGLNQMYSLRYGTIPIVRSIGGLKDTIIDLADGGYGLTHPDTTVEQICESITRATTFYKDQTAFRKTRKHIMAIDHSWDASAIAYNHLYNTIKN